MPIELSYYNMLHLYQFWLQLMNCDKFSGQQQLNDLLARTSSAEVKLQQCENYRQKLCTDVAERVVRIERHVQQYNDVVTELTRLRRQHISDLITFIFPISELPARR